MAQPRNKYWANIEIAIRHQVVQRGQLIGRLFMYWVIVFLFHQVFQSVGAPPERAWYVAITEWIVLSTPPLALQIAEDVNKGQIAYFLLRPMHYLSLRFSECLGTLLVRFILLGISCLGLGFYLTGFFPGNAETWILGTVFGVLSITLYNLLLMLIGLSAFWVTDIKTIMYLNLTATLSLGGCIVPLSFYSNGMRTASFCTPYPWILWGPAEYITGGSVNLGNAVLGWGFWMLFLSAAVIFLYNKGAKTFIVEGG